MNKRDKQILEILAQNCRISNSTIAQALNISKDAITYRIKNLEKKGQIKQNILFIDARPLGFSRYHFLIKFSGEAKNKQEIYNRLKTHPSVMWINSFIGLYDLQIILDATDSFQLNHIREELFILCEHQIQEYIILTHLYDLEFTQLNPVLDLNTKFEKKNNHSFSGSLTTKRFPVNQEFEKYKPDKVEIKILEKLANNPKAKLIEIGNKIGVNRTTIKRKIEKLIKNKIILNFGSVSNLSELGFVTYYILVRLEQETPSEILKKPFTKLKNIFYAGRMIGNYDMIIYLNARTPQELKTSIEQFKESIGEHILHYDLLVQDKLYYWRQFTEGIKKELIKNIE